MEILLNSKKSKNSVNLNNSLTINLTGGKRILPQDKIYSNLSEIDVYNSERMNCSKFRITAMINPICSNVLFNNVTEIVKDEGSKNVVMINYNTNNDNITHKFYHEKEFFENINNWIRDTQLSNEANGFVYHCGSNIFNNHLLRSKTFKTVCKVGDKNDANNFNTISDLARSYDGKTIKTYTDYNGNISNSSIKMHLYLGEEILSFKECYEKKLEDVNGWVGFKNVGKMKVYNDDNDEGYPFDWFNVINSKKSSDFIDMYPERDLFSFNPKYNKFKKRLEKNWNYILTYPRYSVDDEEIITFIKKFNDKPHHTALKIFSFNDTDKNYDGTDGIKFVSVSKHGLSKGDYINVYNGDEMIMNGVYINDVIDDYTFEIKSGGTIISDKWIELPSPLPEEYTIKGDDGADIVFTINASKKTVTTSNNKTYYIIDGNKFNYDDNVKGLSFCKLVNGEEVNYYVRVFSKIPNFKFADKIYTIDDLKNKNIDIKKYQSIENEFTSHIGKMSFAKTIYNDSSSEIVFTDDIDISALTDNLGRPVTEIYLTLLKNNNGYKEWYGKNGKEIDTTKENIEYSHCFGKLNCAFKLSEPSISNTSYNNILQINNLNTNSYEKGINVNHINKDRIIENGNEDEIQYNSTDDYSGDVNFYGDLCCYSKNMMDEVSIQMVSYRFNTAQRELTNEDTSFNHFKEFNYDEIISDDYDNEFNVDSTKSIGSLGRKEGYYYRPHYMIPIKTFSLDIKSASPSFLNVKSINSFEKNAIIINTVDKMVEIGKDDYVYMYDCINKVVVKFVVNDIISNNNIKLTFNNEGELYVNTDDVKRYKFYIITNDIPYYAKRVDDDSCRYRWRAVIENGFDELGGIDVYPFANGAFYVNKNINLYLKRQDPEGKYLRPSSFPFPIPSSDTILFSQENNYYDEKDIIC